VETVSEAAEFASTAHTRDQTSGEPDPDRWARLQPPRTTGMTSLGVVVLICALTLLGGLADMAISGHRGHLFGVLFAIASALAAIAVRRRDLNTAMIAPPLVYCLMIVVMSFIDRSDLTGGFVTREAFYLGKAFVTGAPAIWIGTALAFVVAVWRKRAAGRLPG
jgi:hypothetical protein